MCTCNRNLFLFSYQMVPRGEGGYIAWLINVPHCIQWCCKVFQIITLHYAFSVNYDPLKTSLLAKSIDKSVLLAGVCVDQDFL